MRQNLKDNMKAEFSKTLIIDAFYSLIKKKPFQEISITEIAETAGVSRLTFYRNFESKENVVFEYSDRIRKAFYGRIAKTKETLDLSFMLNCCFSIREAEHEACIPVYRDSLLYSTFHRSWNLALDEAPFLSHLTYTRQKIMVDVMYSILVDWVEGKNKIDKAEAIEAIMDIVSGKKKADYERALVTNTTPVYDNLIW